MSKYYKIGKFTNDLFTVNIPTEITPEQFHDECRKMEDKAYKKKLHFSSWWIPETNIRVFGLVETNTIYGFIIG